MCPISRICPRDAPAVVLPLCSVADPAIIFGRDLLPMLQECLKVSFVKTATKNAVAASQKLYKKLFKSYRLY